MKKDGDKEIIICECNSTDHQIVFLYSDDEYGDRKIPTCYAHVHLSKRPFWDRLKYGIKYIFGYKSRFGAFDEFIFNPEDAMKIGDLAEYLSDGLDDKKWHQFLNHVRKECRNNGVELDLQDAKYLELSDSIKCGGYFDSDILKLACAMKHEEAKTLLVHEYCHMTQWLDKIPLWEQAAESLNLVDGWLEGREVEEIGKHIRVSKDLELDNEKRAVEIMKEWDLGIDIEAYIKKSNAYVLFYLYLEKSRKWSVPENSPYTNKRILEAMSTKFDMNYDVLDPEIEKIFREENI